MKILHVQKLVGVAGSENYLLRILPSLSQAGIHVEFLALETTASTGKNDLFYAKLDEAGVPYHRVRIGKVPTPISIAKVHAVVRKVRPDIVHSHLIHADVFGALVKRLLMPSMTLISTKHGYEEAYINEHGLDASQGKKNLYWLLCRFAEANVTTSYAISEGLRSFFVDTHIAKKGEMGLVYYGTESTHGAIATNDPAPAPESDPLRVADLQLVLVGRLVRFKGHRFAFEALAKLAPKYPSVKLVVVGSGGLDAELKAQVAALGLEKHVDFVGNRPNARDYMRAADVVLVPSVSEGFGLVFLEAFDAGRPVVAFDVPAGNEIIEHERSGLLVKPYDVDAYAAAIDKLLASADERARLAEGGRARFRERFRLERMADETRAFYETVLRRKSSPPAAVA